MKVFIIVNNDRFFLPNMLVQFISEYKGEVVGIGLAKRKHLSWKSFQRKLTIFGSLGLLRLAAKLAWKRPPSTKQVANKFGVKYLELVNINSEESLALLRKQNPDILISLQDQILKPAIIRLPNIGCINKHAALLPKYRGVWPIFWALLNNEPEVGFTIHWIDAGIDTGKIIVQKRIPVKPDSTVFNLYQQVFELCSQSLIEALNKIEKDPSCGTHQPEEVKEYFSFPQKKDVKKFKQLGKRVLKGWPICAGKGRWLVGLTLILVVLSRLVFLGADLPSTHVEIEEKPGGVNARTKLFFDQWGLYQNWCQPMVYSPLPNIISYVSFRISGLGLAQFRLPFALASALGLVAFYLVVRKQTSFWPAWLALLVYALNFNITTWNRSALPENLYLLFMPLAICFLMSKELKGRNIFIVTFLASLNIVVKTDGYPFYLAVLAFLLLRALVKRSLRQTILPVILGSAASLAIFLALFAFTDSFKYIGPMYSSLSAVFSTPTPLLERAGRNLHKLITILIEIDPYLLLAYGAALPTLIIKHRRLNRIDWFMLLFLTLAGATRFLIPTHLIYWKRIMFLFFPIIYLIFRSLHILWARDQTPSRPLLKIPEEIIFGLTLISLFLLLAIPYLYFPDEFAKAFADNKTSLTYIFLLLLGVCGLSASLFFNNEKQKVRYILTSLILFFVFTSLTTNAIKTTQFFLPENIKYSYQENKKYTELIPEKEMVVSHEQAVRAFVYLTGKHDFYYNPDGGTTPVPYRMVWEREDLRYFILNIEEFNRARWGLPNQVRLALIKKRYPDLKLLGVMYASKTPLAIYDKYGHQQN